MKLSDGLFLECCRRSRAASIREIEYDEMIIDNCAHAAGARPEQFDVLVIENLYGDILSDLCAGLVGGLGVVPGAQHRRRRAPSSRPCTAARRTSRAAASRTRRRVILLGVDDAAPPRRARGGARVEAAVHAVLTEPSLRTRDLGGPASLDEFTRAVVERVG